MSFYYKPEWCLYAASEVERNQAAKKRFVDEYESNVCYRKEAKNLLNDKIMGLTEVVPSRRADTVNYSMKTSQNGQNLYSCWGAIFPICLEW